MKLFPSLHSGNPHWQIALAGILAISHSSCQLLHREDKVEAKEKPDALYPQPTQAVLTPEAQELNDTARILAGLDALADQDKHTKWRSEDFWRAHRTGSNAIWAEFANKRGVKVRNWAATEVVDVNTVPVVFQPFGGPDFVFSHLMFPNAETFVLCGSAPCLDLPKMGDVSAVTLAATVFSVRNAMAAALKVTQEESKSDVTPRGAGLQGALPVLLALAARTGHIIESVEMMPIDDQNGPPSAPLAMDPVEGAPTVILKTVAAQPASACVVTLRAGDGTAKRLFYFNQGLTDEALPESAALLSFLNKQPRIVAVLNETSHELHQPNTLRLQKYLAKHAVAIVQDASGVPHRHFDQTVWNIQRYGSYSGAPGEFREFDQPDLVAAYNDQTNRPMPLPFGRGPIGQEISGALMIARPLVREVAEIPTREEMAPLNETSPVLPVIAGGSTVPDPGLPVSPDAPVTESEFLKPTPGPIPSIIVARPPVVGPTAATSTVEPMTHPEPSATASLTPASQAPGPK